MDKELKLIVVVSLLMHISLNAMHYVSSINYDKINQRQSMQKSNDKHIRQNSRGLSGSNVDETVTLLKNKRNASPSKNIEHNPASVKSFTNKSNLHSESYFARMTTFITKTSNHFSEVALSIPKQSLHSLLSHVMTDSQSTKTAPSSNVTYNKQQVGMSTDDFFEHMLQQSDKAKLDQANKKQAFKTAHSTMAELKAGVDHVSKVVDNLLVKSAHEASEIVTSYKQSGNNLRAKFQKMINTPIDLISMTRHVQGYMTDTASPESNNIASNATSYKKAVYDQKSIMKNKSNQATFGKEVIDNTPAQEMSNDTPKKVMPKKAVPNKKPEIQPVVKKLPMTKTKVGAALGALGLVGCSAWYSNAEHSKYLQLVEQKDNTVPVTSTMYGKTTVFVTAGLAGLVYAGYTKYGKNFKDWMLITLKPSSKTMVTRPAVAQLVGKHGSNLNALASDLKVHGYNKISISELTKLGYSAKQAQQIIQLLAK